MATHKKLEMQTHSIALRSNSASLSIFLLAFLSNEHSELQDKTDSEMNEVNVGVKQAKRAER